MFIAHRPPPSHRIATPSPYDLAVLARSVEVITRSQELLRATRAPSTRLFDGPRHRDLLPAIDCLAGAEEAPHPRQAAGWSAFRRNG